MCVLSAGDGPRFVAALRGAGVDTVELPAGPDLDLTAVPRLVREIRRFAPDLVHTHLIHGDLFGQFAARLTRTPAISTVHGTHEFYERQPYRTLSKLAWASARRTIAISDWVARFLVEKTMVSRDRVRVVRYGLDVTPWSHDESARQSVRTELGLSADEVVFGVASRLVPHKGHAFLIDAFRIASARAPEARLIVAGDGPLREELESKALRELPRGTFRFVGYRADVAAFMHACDALVFPTLPEFGEGFGLAALEAMAAGRPVIATNVGPLPEVVSNGEAGILVPPWDAASLAEALVRLTSDRELRTTLGRGARERAANRFPIHAMVDGVRSVYREALSR